MPTPTPMEKALMSICMGKAMLTAARAFSPRRDTQMLSTMLYRAWTSMDRAMGREMLIKSFGMGS